MLAKHGVMLLLASSLLVSLVSAGGEHGHGALWEWAGVFKLAKGENYVWSAERAADGEYVDPEMQILIMATDHADSHGIEEQEAAAEAAWEAKSIAEVESGGVIPIGTAVHIVFNRKSWVSTFQVTVPNTGAYVIFAQHLPTEFENMFHYLKDEHGTDVEPAAQEPEGEEDGTTTTEHKDRWALVGLGTLATVFPSLVLILVAGPTFMKLSSDLLPAASCFASGAIFAAAVFLMMPEGYLLAGEGKEEVDATWTWGTALMTGWFLCVCLHFLAEMTGFGSTVELPKEKDGKEMVGQPRILGGLSGIRWDVCGPVLFGDFFHNLVDGMVIAFAAKSCSTTLVSSIIVATVLHELPQEFGDFVILISKGRMSWVLAAAFNFISGLAAVLGAVIAYETDVSSQFEGLALAFGAGVYLFVALTELGPAFIETQAKNWVSLLSRLVLFAAGTVLIGLVLLDHEHCIAGGSSEGGGGGHHHH